MGSIIAVLVAFITIFMNDQIFKILPTTSPGPLVSSYVFLIALFLLLCEIPLYPSSLRELGFFVQGIFEVLVAAFIAEEMTVDFWLPLEAAAMENVPKLADIIDDMLSIGEWRCDLLCDTLRSTIARYIISYSLSIFFLMTALHATRIIDLRVLDKGVCYFIYDIIFKLKRFVKRQFKSAITKELEDNETLEEDEIISEITNTNPGPGGSLSDNLLTEKKPQKKRSKRNRTATTSNDGDRSDKSDGDTVNFGKRQTRSSTYSPEKKIFCGTKQSINRKSIFSH